MFRHLLVPLDGSCYAEQVLPVAARLARASGGTITLVQVLDPSHRVMSAHSFEARNTRATTRQDYLEQVRQRPYLSTLPIQTEVLVGDPAVMIISLAADPSIDLVLLASHGSLGITYGLSESVATSLAHSAQASVLVLHDQQPLRIHRSHNGSSFVRALVSVDTSTGLLAAVLPAVRMVSALSAPGQGEIHLAHIVVDSPTESRSELGTRLQIAKQHLGAIGLSMRKLLRACRDPERVPLALTWAVTVERGIVEGIVRRAEHGEQHTERQTVHRCDLIVMTARRSNQGQKWVQESITEQVLHATHLPVLVVRPVEDRMETEQQVARPAMRAR